MFLFLQFVPLTELSFQSIVWANESFFWQVGCRWDTLLCGVPNSCQAHLFYCGYNNIYLVYKLLSADNAKTFDGCISISSNDTIKFHYSEHSFYCFSNQNCLVLDCLECFIKKRHAYYGTTLVLHRLYMKFNFKH